MKTTYIIAETIMQIAESDATHGRIYVDYDGYTFFISYDCEDDFVGIDQIVFEYGNGTTSVLSREPNWFNMELFLEISGSILAQKAKEVAAKIKHEEESREEAMAIEMTNEYLRSCGDTTSKYL